MAAVLRGALGLLHGPVGAGDGAGGATAAPARTSSHRTEHSADGPPEVGAPHRHL